MVFNKKKRDCLPAVSLSKTLKIYNHFQPPPKLL